MQVVRAIGGRAPLHLTSVGKLFLAFDDPQRVRAYATRTGLAGHTRNSITELATLERELTQARQTAVRARRRGAGAGCALLRGRHLRRPVKPGRWPVGLGAGRPARGIVARTCSSHCGPDLARPRSPSLTAAWDAPIPPARCAAGGCDAGACATTGIASSHTTDALGVADARSSGRWSRAAP